MNDYSNVNGAVKYFYKASRTAEDGSEILGRIEITSNLNRLLENESPENLRIREFAIKNIGNVQYQIKKLCLLSIASITLAIFLPAIPAITIVVVSSVALAVLAVAYMVGQKQFEFYNDYERMKNFYITMVLNTTNEAEIDLRITEELNNAMFKRA